jgi:hypothetical protein
MEVKMERKRVQITVDIEAHKDFDIQDLAVGLYYEDSIADTEMILMKQGDSEEDEDYFRVVEYLEVTEK